ncbi:MAG TPA: glycosyltransferase family A protein [Candidatus Acidoferrales bacterium]|nr:glycosyltransferase family A protein [Candidatus Acidoferrales bacterium]
MSDITAVILSIGEEITTRAIESVRRQTLAPEDIIVIRNVSPMYRALNLGASKVKTEFFVQVDSDMILDENCLEDLRGCMSPNVGMVLGSLRDPLMGRIGWIKLFRTKCFEKVQYRDLVSADLVFTEEMSNHGWMMVYAIRAFDEVPNEIWHTFGEHRPDYTPHYTYSKHLVEGRRYRYRKAPGALAWHLKKLANSYHPAALIAQIALAHGIFIRESGDLLKPYVYDQKFDHLQRFLETSGSPELSPLSSASSMDKDISDYRRLLPWFCFNAKKIFKDTYQAGTKFRKANAFAAFKRCLAFLNDSRDPFAWIGKVGLCHGLFFDAYENESFAKDYKLLKELITEDVLRSLIKAKLKHFPLALKRRIVSTYSWGLARRAIKRSYSSAKPSFPSTPRSSA